MTQFKLLKEKRFGPLFITQFLGAFNDNLLKNALVILITFKGVSILGVPPSQMVALAGGIFILPFFIFSATAGQLADKYEKAKIIHWIKLVEIAIMVVAALGFYFEYYGLILITLFLMGLHSTFFGPIKYSILPEHLKEDELVGGNALIEAGTFLSILLGTILSGVLAGMEDYGPLFIGLALVACAVVGWLACQKIPNTPPVDSTLELEWNPIRPTWDIYLFTKQTRSIYLSILGISWFWFFGGAMLSLLPSYCKETLQAGPSVVTLFLTCFSIGIGLGSMLCEKLSRRQLELGLVPLGSIGISVFCLDLSCIPLSTLNQLSSGYGLWSFLNTGTGIRLTFDLLLISLFSGFFIVPLYTLIQERSKSTHRSRIIAGNNILNAFFMVLSALFLLFMFQLKFTAPQIFLVLSLLNALVAIYIYSLLPEFLLRFLAWMLANVMYRMRITGETNIPKEGAAVLVCNHVSFVDWLILAAGVKRPIRFVMDHSYSKGILGLLLKQAKVIPIASRKESPQIMNAAFQLVADELKAGELICIFPEGKITYDGNMNPFKRGIEIILQKTPVPVIPMALGGMWGSFFSREGGHAIKKKPKRFWSRIEVKIGKTISPEMAKADYLYAQVDLLLNS